MGIRESPMEGVGMNWAGNTVLVTGATGLVGSWLVRRLLGDGARVVALVRDWDPQSDLIRCGDIQRCVVVSGHLEDYGTVERAISEQEVQTVFHLGAQAIVGTAFRSPLLTFESNIRGTYNLLEVCRLQSGLVERVVVRHHDGVVALAQVQQQRPDPGVVTVDAQHEDHHVDDDEKAPIRALGIRTILPIPAVESARPRELLKDMKGRSSQRGP